MAETIGRGGLFSQIHRCEKPNAPADGASKAGLNSLGQSLAKALAPDGICVFCLAPGWVDTDTAADHLAGPRGHPVFYLFAERKPHRSRAKNHTASVAMPACGNHAAMIGSTKPFEASVVEKLVKM